MLFELLISVFRIQTGLIFAFNRTIVYFWGFLSLSLNCFLFSEIKLAFLLAFPLKF